MKKAFFLLLFASFLLLLPGCLSESIKTKEECASLAPPPSGPNWAGQDPSQYKDAGAYEQVGCWHEAAIWYAIQGKGDNAVISCSSIRDVQWDYPTWLDDEYNLCIGDVAEKLKDPIICQQILNVESNKYIRGRCLTRAQNAADREDREFCNSTLFILAGLGAFMFANSKIEK